MAKPADAVTIVVPVHNAPERLEQFVPAWPLVLEKTHRPLDILIVDDGSTDGTREAANKLAERIPHTRVLRHESRKGYGACLKTALAETRTPLFFYTALDYPYTPADIRLLLDRIDLRDEILNKRPDMISGCRSGLETPEVVYWASWGWKVFWRVFAGMPILDPTPWLGWPEFWHGVQAQWVYGVPLADVNSCFKLFRTDFLRSFPIQSDGDFVHTELVAKATFLTSIMDEVPLTPKPDPIPPMGPTSEDARRVRNNPEFTFPATPVPAVPPVVPPGEPLPAPRPDHPDASSHVPVA
jgi:glycosyltransferase involved in cell wall biosynthesis